MYMGEMLLKCITSVALRLRMQIHNLHSIPIYEIHGINQLDYWKNPLGDGQIEFKSALPGSTSGKSSKAQLYIMKIHER